MNCTSINFEGQEIKFSSDMELDLFLESIRDKVHVIGSDASLSVNMQKTTEDVISKITEKVKSAEIEEHRLNDDGDVEIYYKIPGSIGTTRFVQTYTLPGGTKPLVTPFNEVEFFKKKRDELKKAGKTDAEIDQQFKEMKKLWKDLTDYGTEIHAIYEAVITGKPIPTTLPEHIRNQAVVDCNNFLEHLRAVHGKNCKFLSEVPLISSEISETYKNSIDSINGRADLIVIDEDGFAHIYDFKVSRKDVGSWQEQRNDKIAYENWWHTTKKHTAEYQMAFYKAILKQHGITVKTTAIVPVKIDPEYKQDNEYIMTGVNGVDLDVSKIVKLRTDSDKQKIVDSILPVQHIKADLQSVNDEMSGYFGEYSVSSQVQRYDIRVESSWDKFVKLVPKGDKRYDEGFRFHFYNSYAEGGGRYVYFKTKEETMTALGEYIGKLNERHGDEIQRLGEEVADACDGVISLEEFGKNYKNAAVSGYLRRIFKKYIVNGWELDVSPELLSAGLFVFKSHADNVIEVVTLTDQHVFDKIEALNGSIFGHFGGRRYEEDDKQYLDSTYASTEAIKTLVVLNHDRESWKNYKLNGIQVFNIWEQHGVDVNLETLNETYRVLGVYANSSGHPVQHNIQDSDYTHPVLRAVIKAKTIKGATAPDSWSKKTTFKDMFDADEFLKMCMMDLENEDSVAEMLAHPEKKFSVEDANCVAYMEFAKARAELRGIQIYSENNIATLAHASTGKGGSMYTGLNVNAPQNSPSLNVQMMQRLEAMSASEINRKTELESRDFRKAMKKLKDHHSSIWGTGIGIFDNLFVRDAEGKIDKSFRLKDPTKYSDLAEAEVEFIYAFLKVVNDRRYPSPEAEEQARADGSWFDVPLTRGNFQSHVHNSSVMEGIKSSLDESWNPLNLLNEQSIELNNSRKLGRPFNKFSMGQDTRNTLLGAYDVSHFETHLEDVALEYIKTYVAEEVHTAYLPVMHGIQIALQYQQGMYGNDNESTIEYLDKFITTTVYSAPIMDKHLQGPYKILSAIKNVTTATALGFNFRSGLREMMQGMWIHISRTMAESYGRDQFTKGEIAQAWGIIFKESIHDFNKLTLIDALNVQYRMANADNDQVATILSQTRAGIKNFNSDKLYFCNKFPDTYHRMGILIAKMIHDGCWEAHTMEDDHLVYDFSKDKRFDLLFKDGSDKNSEEYKKQHSLYTAMRLQFIKEGEMIEEGQPLPRAYTIQEGNSIKSFSELCFGHYDKNTQMLAKKMFLGAMMLQFRTFISAKLEQWILKPGTYDQGHYVEKKDPDGVRLVRVYNTDEEGNITVDIMREDQLKGGENWEPMIDWEGRFMEGILYSLWDFGKALVHWDTEELKKLWANPTKRANFKIFLWDMIWMHILMAIVGSLILYNDEVELSPVEWTFASALYTSFQDGPIDQIVESMFSDLNPPMMSQVQKIFSQAGNMVTGDQGLGDTIVNTFGALAPLKHLEEAIA